MKNRMGMIGIFLVRCLTICMVLPIIGQQQIIKDNWIFIDFDSAMKKELFPQSITITERVVGIEGEELFDFFKRLYDKNNPSNLSISDNPLIPKIIHQIWLGCPVPEAFKAYMQSWVDYHMGPEWEYRLWLDKDVESLNLYNRAFYDMADGPGVKSDLLRWELLYMFGGVYVDIDFECLQSLDLLHHQYNFYTALQPLDTQFVQLGAALVGASPRHPILKHCIETIKDDWHKKGAPAKTGPIHFTRSFYQVAGKDGFNDVAFPAFYFYPLGCEERVLDREGWVNQGAFAVHHWAKSWMPPQYRRHNFKRLANDTSTESWRD